MSTQRAEDPYSSEEVLRALRTHTAETTAAFFTPHLRAGMRVLDCGCGPGTITAGLAAHVAPGETVGLDRNPDQVARALALARERGVTTMRVEQGDMQALPFPDAAFDAVFSCYALEYLRDPLVALREMRRVLRPGGVIGIRTGEPRTMRLSPESPATERFLRWNCWWREQGGSPYLGPAQHRLLRDAGFRDCQVSAVATCHVGRGPDATRNPATAWVSVLMQPERLAMTIEQGWATRQEVEEMAAAVRAWGEAPDALSAALAFTAVGWAA